MSPRPRKPTFTKSILEVADPEKRLQLIDEVLIDIVRNIRWLRRKQGVKDDESQDVDRDGVADDGDQAVPQPKWPPK
jgi:hypothetical protein